MGLFKRKSKNSKAAMARQLITLTEPRNVISEQFRTIRTNINFSMPDEDLRTLLVTSSLPGEGKSTNSSNLAVVFAQGGKKVIIIDGDMRKPTTHYTFGIANTRGLSDLLTRQYTLEKVVQETHVPNLDIISSGPIPPNPAELLGSKMMDTVITELKEIYDVIIFDAPPVLSVTDAQILANKCDGTVLVVGANHTEKEMALKAKELLTSSQAKMLGVILNRYEMEKDHYYYQYYGNK